MENPLSRRLSSSSSSASPYPTNLVLPISDNNQFQPPAAPQATNLNRLLNSAKIFMKKPHAFPFLLSAFLFLTWVSLKLQHHPHPKANFNAFTLQLSATGADLDANLARFHSFSSAVMKDRRGWLVDPVSLALEAGIYGGATTCASVHIGEIRPGSLRGNHRHHFCNETFLIWGAKTLFRVENTLIDKGYAEVIVDADEVAVAASSRGTAHALINIDSSRTTFFVGCQDGISYNDSTSDFKVWKDVKN